MHSSLVGANMLMGQLPGVMDAVAASDALVRPGGGVPGMVLSSEAAAWASSAALFADINTTLAELRARVAALPPSE